MLLFSKEDTNLDYTENGTIPGLLEIFTLDQIIVFAVVAIVMVIFIVLIVRKGKHLKVKKVTVGPFEAEIEEEKDEIIPAYRIAILRQPTSVSGNPATLNTLIVRVYGKDGKALKNKRVTITLEGKESNPEYYISGSLSEISDDKGEAVFSGLSLLRRGAFSIVFHADGVVAKARPFSVTPPGLDVDFEGKKFGSDEYISTLRLAISLNKAGDKVIMDGEEIN